MPGSGWAAGLQVQGAAVLGSWREAAGSAAQRPVQDRQLVWPDHKIHIYTEYTSDCLLVGIGTPPPPWTKGRGDTLACGWGGGGVPSTTTGKKLSTLSALWAWYKNVILIEFWIAYRLKEHVNSCGLNQCRQLLWKSSKLHIDWGRQEIITLVIYRWIYKSSYYCKYCTKSPHQYSYWWKSPLFHLTSCIFVSISSSLASMSL